MSKIDHYILDGKTPIPCANALKAWQWHKENIEGCKVGFDTILVDGEKVEISTVFLTLDHSFYGGEPILFETCIFFTERKSYSFIAEREFNKSQVVDRYMTWEEAERGHKKWMESQDEIKEIIKELDK